MGITLFSPTKLALSATPVTLNLVMLKSIKGIFLFLKTRNDEALLTTIMKGLFPCQIIQHPLILI